MAIDGRILIEAHRIPGSAPRERHMIIPGATSAWPGRTLSPSSASLTEIRQS